MKIHQSASGTLVDNSDASTKVSWIYETILAVSVWLHFIISKAFSLQMHPKNSF